MTTQEALQLVHDGLTAILDAADVVLNERTGSQQLREALERVHEILEQEGCEHFDSGCRDGRLTTLMDIVING